MSGPFEIQSLESRQMMANVAVAVSNGLLQIAAGGADDAIAISASSTQLIVSAKVGTTVNGKASVAYPKFSVSSIYAALGGGDDRLSIENVDQGLGGTIDMGAGDDFVGLSRSKLTGMLLQTQAGKDLVSVFASTMQSVIVDTGADNDLVSVLDNTVFDYSSLNLGAGNDVLLTVSNTVFGFTSIDGGAGNDLALGFRNNLPGGSFVTGVEYRMGV